MNDGTTRGTGCRARIALVGLLASLGLIAGCKVLATGQSAGAPADEVPTTATTPAGSESTTPDAAEAHCAALKDQFRATLEQAPGTCRSDDDCGTAPGGIDGGGCGRVVDAASADALYELYTQIRNECGLDFHCGPRAVQAVCEDGRCAERDLSTSVPIPG